MPNEEETLAHPEQPRFLLSSWVWAVVLFVFFGVIVAITFGTLRRSSNYEEERARTRVEKLKTARTEWEKTEGSYGWIDQAKGVVHIPIARAMELAMADLQTKKPMAAGPIATPAAAEAPASATGAPQPANPPVTAPAGAGSAAPKSIERPNSEIRAQPAAAANPPNVQAGTQPGASATPAAIPQSQSEVPPVSPTVPPVQHPVGTPLPARGAPGTSPAVSATPAPPKK